MATTSRRLVSLSEAADILAVCPKTVRSYVSEGHLEAVRLGTKTLRITPQGPRCAPLSGH